LRLLPKYAAMWFVAGLAEAVILSFVIRAWYTKTLGLDDAASTSPWRQQRRRMT